MLGNTFPEEPADETLSQQAAVVVGKDGDDGLEFAFVDPSLQLLASQLAGSSCVALLHRGALLLAQKDGFQFTVRLQGREPQLPAEAALPDAAERRLQKNAAAAVDRQHSGLDGPRHS